MAKDDYYVIVYRILAYLYACLKSGERPDIAYISADSEAINVNRDYWEYIMRHLANDGYVEGVTIFNVIGKATPSVKINAGLMITPKGIDFLESNSAMSRAKEFLKTLKETIPGI